MTAVKRSITNLGGLAATHELRTRGHTRAELAGAVRSDVVRVRKGWYAPREVHPRLLAAARVGGIATCATGLELHGIWVVRDPAVHVRVPANAARLRSPQPAGGRLRRGVVVHWLDERSRDERVRALMSTPISRLLRDPLECLEDGLHCMAPELVAASADSLLRADPSLKRVWPSFVRAAPERFRSALQLVDGVCESGIETVFWVRTRALTVPIRRQVELGIGRVDFLIGDRLVVEVDGEEFHRDFEGDRARDAAFSALGYRTLRFSYTQVLEHWNGVLAAVVGALARGDHR